MKELNKTTIQTNDDHQTEVDITNGADKKLLVTILFADIQGYSLIMNKEEAHGIHMVKTFKSQANELITKHGGAIVKDMGDGYIAIFPGIEGAMAYGLEYQYAMIAEQIPVRIGIHSGDVTVNNKEVYGNGVNLAARIEATAKAGGVYFSKLVADNIASNIDFKTVGLGNFQLKNFPNPVPLFALDHEGLSHHKNTSDEPKNRGFFNRLFWVPKEKRNTQIISALGGSVLYGAVTFLYGCNDAEGSNPIIDPDEECGDVTNHLNEALLQNGELASNVNDNMSFDEAFAAARDEVGAGGIFAWHGQVYNTYTRSEYEGLSSTEQTSQIEKIEEIVIQHESVTNEPLDVQEVLKMESVNLDDDLNAEALVFKDGDQIVKLEIDSDGNGSFDLTIADTNGDGQLDTIGRLTIDGSLNSSEALSEPITPDAFLEQMQTAGDDFDVFALTQSNAEDSFVEATDDNFDHHIDENQIIESLDLDEDGINDIHAIDTNNDGKEDIIAVDYDNNGIAETVYQDTNYDGIVDVQKEDLDQDGITDEFITNNEQTVEEEVIDETENIVIESIPLNPIEIISTPVEGIANEFSEENINAIESIVEQPSDENTDANELPSDAIVEENVTSTEDALNTPPEPIIDSELNPIGPAEETPIYDEAIYNEDIPGMTSNDNVDDWDGVENASSDEQIAEAYEPEISQIMNDPSVVAMNDSNSDGTPDEFLLDANQDGYAETIALDHNQNGTPEEYIIDMDMDGEADTLASDFDEDGNIDEIL